MPRDGSNVYHIPPGTEGVTDTTIESAKYNNYIADIAIDLNAPRPIVAGGTGATTPGGALAALSGEMARQVITNYNSDVFVPGSFYSAGSATGAPVAGHAFAGICYSADTSNMFITARDQDDTSQPGKAYTRQLKAGVWSSWKAPTEIDVSGTPVANMLTTWSGPTGLQGIAITGLVKGNGASAPTAAAAGTDYAPATSGSSILKGNGSGGFAAASAGTDFVGPPANPTATIGLTAVNGSASTGMRSDAAPALSQSITPVWTGVHQFNAQTTFEGQAVSPLQTLTDGATISTWDAAQGQKAKVTLGAAGRTMPALTNVVEGTTYYLWCLQDGTGGRTITTWNSGANGFDFGVAGAPVLSAGANKADLLCFEAISVAGTLKLRYMGIAQGFS